MNIKKNVSATIRRVMQQRDLTLNEAAEEFEIARSSLQSYLKEECSLRADTLEQLSSKLNVPLTELIDEEHLNREVLGKTIHPLLHPLAHEVLCLSDVLYRMDDDECSCEVASDAKC